MTLPLRRAFLRLVVAALGVLALSPACSPAMAEKRPPFVLIHGAFGDGGVWFAVKPKLEEAGYKVYATSLPGFGDRVKENGPDISLTTHIDAVVELIEKHKLQNVILVGHSYGGMVISGVVDRIPERIARVVYVDAMLPRDGQSAFDNLAPGMVQGFRDGAREKGNGWAIPPYVAGAPPQPIQTMEEKISLKNPKAADVPGTFIVSVDPATGAIPFSGMAHRAQQRIWPVKILRTTHMIPLTMPNELSQLLVEAAQASTPLP